MIDIMAVKLKVIQTACGITALSEIDLLHRLEKLYLEGIEEGVKIAKDHLQHRGEVMNPPASAAQGAEARKLNMPQRHGTGAVPQGGEAQATQHSAAPTAAQWGDCYCATCGHHDRYHFESSDGKVYCRWNNLCACAECPPAVGVSE